MAEPSPLPLVTPAAGLHVAVDGSGLARPRAGIGTYTREILAAMLAVRPGHRLTLWLPRGIEPPVSSPRLAVRQVPATRLVGRHWQWPARLRRQRPHAYFGPAGLLPLGDVGVPAVVTAHDMAIYLHPEWFPGRQPLSTRLVVPRSMERAHTVICVSRNTAADVAAIFGVPESRLEVIPEGVGRRFRPLDAERTELVRASLRLPERFLLFVGTVEPRKNLDTLIDAWAQMSHRPPLVVAGGWGWGFEATREKMARLAPAGLHHLGEVAPADLPALYSQAAALAHPAWYEGFGLTPLEAMACGTPVVASNASSLPEVVGDAALTVDPGDVRAWCQALEQVFGDPALAGELRRKGLLRAAQFGWETAAERTWRVIERAARG
jgi:glycosyltransferase involved in cell wall biosynthesis